MKNVSCRSRRVAGGFTLIELLTVISIIGVLASMIVPAIATAKKKAQVGRAKTEIVSLVAAINQYQATYGRLPASRGVAGSLSDNCPDFTFGTFESGGTGRTLKSRGGDPLPAIGNGRFNQRQQNNSEIMAILMDLDKYPDGQKTVNDNHNLNPQKISFLNIKRVNDTRSPGVGLDLVYRDLWGNPYIITLDLNYDNRCRDGFYRLDAVSRDPSIRSGLGGYNGLIRAGAGTDNFEANTTVMVWSLGPDGDRRGRPGADAGTPATKDPNRDNVLSWK